MFLASWRLEWTLNAHFFVKVYACLREIVQAMFHCVWWHPTFQYPSSPAGDGGMPSHTTVMSWCPSYNVSSSAPLQVALNSCTGGGGAMDVIYTSLHMFKFLAVRDFWADCISLDCQRAIGTVPNMRLVKKFRKPAEVTTKVFHWLKEYLKHHKSHIEIKNFRQEKSY